MPWPPKIKMFGETSNRTKPPNPPRTGLPVVRPKIPRSVRKRAFMQDAVVAMLVGGAAYPLSDLAAVAERLFEDIERKTGDPE